MAKSMSEYRQNGIDYIIDDPTIAPVFVASAAYNVGQCVKHEGNLYRFTSAHPAGAWNSGHVTQVLVGGELQNKENQISDLKSALSNNAFNVNGFENGAISETNGTNVSSSERIRTKSYIAGTVKTLRSTNASIRFMLYGYIRSTGVYVGALQSDGSFGTSAGSHVTIDMTDIYRAHPLWNFKVVIRLSGGSVQIDTVSDVFFDSLIPDITTNANGITNLERKTNVSVFSAEDYENGSIAYSDGSSVASPSRVRTKGYIPDTANLFYSTNADIRFQLFAWNKSGDYVGALYQRQITVADAGTYPVLDMAAIRSNANYKDYNFRVVILSTSGNVRVDNLSGIYTESIEQAAYDARNFGIVENVSNAANINSFYLWENGGLNLVTGRNATSPTRARTRGYVPTNAGVVSFREHTQYRGFFIAAYTLDGAYVGAYKSDGTFVRDGSETGWSTFDLQELYKRFPNYRFRLTVYVRNGGEAILPTEFEDWSITNAIYSKPTTLKVIQYNIGKFNMGLSHSDSRIADPATKLANYKEFLANENPDFLFLQEFTPYFDTDDTQNADTVLFNPFFVSKSYYEREIAIKGQYVIGNSNFSYLHTSGDQASWCVYGETTIDGKRIAVVSGVLNVETASGTTHSEQQIRALTKLVEQELQGGVGFNLLNYDYAIIGMDTNCLSQAEADTVREFMAGKGYKSANWDYFGYKDTYNLATNMYKAIDNIFVKGNARITRFTVPSVYDGLASDHFPVIAEIRLM